MVWYKRDAHQALMRVMDLTLEQRGAYATLVELNQQYGSVLDDDRFIAGWCRCDVRVWRRIKAALIAAGKLSVGDGYISVKTEGVVYGLEESLRPSAAEWGAIRQRIFERDDFTCQYCGTRGGRLECDHVHPVARGGNHEDQNLVTACFTCNRSKRAKTVDEWLAQASGETATA